jgi:hypothetical protein
VGLPLDFSSPWLDAFLNHEARTNPSQVAVIAIVHRNQGFTYGDPDFTKVGPEPPAWSNFNYVFNPKERTTLNFDTSYEPDTSNPTGVGSPWSQADNSAGAFSPQLVLPGIDAEGPDYNVDFGVVYLKPPDTLGAAAANPGTWTTATIGVTALDDTTGQPTGATATLSALSNSGSGNPPADDTAKLLNDNFYSNGTSWSLDLDGLVPGFYRVYLYAPSNGAVTTGDVDVAGSVVPSLPGDVDGNLVQGVSWDAVDAESEDGTLALGATCSGFCGLAGIQVQYLPEPAGVEGGVLSAWLVWALGRRRAGRRVAAAASEWREADPSREWGAEARASG